MKVLGYFKRGGIKWLIKSRKEGMLIGFDITPKGMIHTLHIAESEVTELTLIK